MEKRKMPKPGDWVTSAMDDVSHKISKVDIHEDEEAENSVRMVCYRQEYAYGTRELREGDTRCSHCEAGTPNLDNLSDALVSEEGFEERWPIFAEAHWKWSNRIKELKMI